MDHIPSTWVWNRVCTTSIIISTHIFTHLSHHGCVTWLTRYIVTTYTIYIHIYRHRYIFVQIWKLARRSRTDSYSLINWDIKAAFQFHEYITREDYYWLATDRSLLNSFWLSLFITLSVYFNIDYLSYNISIPLGIATMSYWN